ncbi:acyloxyacyl hydrolase [Psychromonas aquimarina]|uniref:acyloxyacyl hydrolase n=1 Tax=Psychromonas aquimarina TaxID=444919 RepID=UPI0004215CC4|nr:acyloxyacyl hydrolase [Psychromonas aquimarina]
MEFKKIFIVFILLFSPCFSSAQELSDMLYDELKFGLLAHDVKGFWSDTKREQGVDINIEGLFPPFARLLGGVIQPAVGASINSHGGTTKLYVDALWKFNIGHSCFNSIGLGIAVHNEETHPEESDMKSLGSRFLTHLPLEIGCSVTPRYSLSLYFDHISNGGTNHTNQGMDTLGLRVGYQF